MGGSKRAASTEPGERPKSRSSELLDGIEHQMGGLEQGPNGTPRGPRLSLPDIGNSSSMSSTSKGPSMIARLQAEYPDVSVAVPPWAEDEWSKDEARLYFETQGMIKPPRKKKNDRRTTAAHKRLVDERLRRRLREVTELQAELGLSAVRPFATSEVHEMVGTLDALANAATSNAGAIKNTRAVRVLTDAAAKATEVADALRAALTPASFDEEQEIARRESGQLNALSRRLVKAGEQSSVAEERNKELNDQLVAANSAVLHAQDQMLKLKSENEALQHHVKQADALRKKAEAKAKEGVETGIRKADETIAARVMHIMKIETDLREEQEKCRVTNLKMRKLRSKATRLEREKADMRKFTDKNTEEHEALKRGLNTAQLRERTYRQQNNWLREQLDETVDALLAGDPSQTPSEDAIKARLSEVYQQLLDIQKAYTDLSAGGKWQFDASRHATPGGSVTSPIKGVGPLDDSQPPHKRRLGTPPKVETPRQDDAPEPEPEPENEPPAVTDDAAAPPEAATMPADDGGKGPPGADAQEGGGADEDEEDYIIHNSELRALVDDLGGVSKVRALCSSDDPELRQTALDAMAMIELDTQARAELDHGRPGVVTPAEADAGQVDGVEEEDEEGDGQSASERNMNSTQNTMQYSDEEWEEEV